MTKAISLKRRSEFLTLSESGKKISTACCLILFKKNNLGFSRLGITVSRKISKRAVVRNKARRRLKEIYLKIFPFLNDNFDLVFIGRSRITESDFESLYKSIYKGLKNERLLKD